METVKKVIIAGGRDFDDFDLLIKVCDFHLHPWDVYSTEIVSGKARGADSLGEDYAKLRGFKVKPFPADWDKHQKAAGYIRNKDMAIYSDVLIAFWNGESKGTKHMIDLAKEQELEVHIQFYTPQVETTPGVYGFTGPNRWLSNFAPCPIPYGNRVFPTVEHFYVAMKTKDDSVREFVSQMLNPAQAKKFGQTIKVRDDWDKIKLSVMEYGLRQKFSQQPYKFLLQNTKGHIEETNYWKDTFWGVCNGVGENHLGKLIMKIRDNV